MKRVLISIILVLGILLVGVAGMLLLIMLRKPPAERIATEQPLSVHAIRVKPEDVHVVMTGYGTVRALNVVEIAPEVSGRVIEIHPKLEVGNVVPAGETLFVIDPRTYKARLDEAQALVEQYRHAVERLKTQLANDQQRLETLKRSRDLAQAEFDRVRRLFEEDQVGTRSGVDAAERAYNAAEDLVDQLERALAVYPIQIEEMTESLASAEARAEIAAINLGWTRVVAPFDARIRSVNLEKNQYVAPQNRVLTLADDSVLEISVPLDSRDVQRWLQFDGTRVGDGAAWFNGLKRVRCSIRWVEDKQEGPIWEGTLDRVQEFDPNTRTLTVAVLVEGEDALSNDNDGLPLVDGMFCSVEIPGRTVKGAYRLPRWAVSFENTAYIASGNRLRTVPVEVAWEHGDWVYVSGGLESGDVVITTRLVNPLENSLLDVSFEDDEGQSS